MTARDAVGAAARADAILAAVGSAAHRFLTLTSPWEDAALAVLEELGLAAGASRAYLFENYATAEGGRRTWQRFQWAAPDAPSQEGNATAVDFAFAEIGAERWERLLSAGEPLHARTADLPEAERGELRVEGIRSIALVPVVVDGTWWGFVGFDECREDRAWPPAVIDALRTAAGLFAAVIGRQRARALLEQRVAALARIAGELVGCGGLEEKLRILADSVVEASGAAGCSVSLVDGDLLELVTVQTCCLPAGYAAAHTAVWDAGTREETRRALDLRAPVVIPSLADELARDARYAPLVEVLSEVGAGALVVIPLVAADRLLGIVHGYYARPGEVHPDELAFLRAIADHGAVAVEHARLVDEAARSTLLEERQRLSRELHDSVSQAVYGIALGARTARTLLDRDPSRVAEPLDYVLELAEAGLAEMRALIFALRPESLEREGLVVALEQQAESVRARHRLAVETDLGTEPDLPLAAKEALYRVAQEALHNIVKHARATHVRLALAATAGDVVLVVADDGAGFDAGAAFPGHLGLRTMRERAEAGGGALVLDSAPGGGTTVTLTLPRHAGSGAAA